MVSWWIVGVTLINWLLHSLTCPFHFLTLSSAYLRQSILLSPFETPETRSLYNTSLKNVAGKVRVEKSWPALQVPEGIDHVCILCCYAYGKTFSLDDRHSSRLIAWTRGKRRIRGLVISPHRYISSPYPSIPSIGSILTYCDTQLLPKVLKSAVQSANTVVFIPSSFDFIRVHNYFRKMSGISFAVLSE